MENSVRRLYSSAEMARVSSSVCAGCGACCRGMGDTVVLDPYDIWLLTNGLRRDFRALLEESIDLHIEGKVILPHLSMRGHSGADADDCFYLGTDGRCVIHEFRPGICRLFPLGRQYDGDKVSYFVVDGGCVRSGNGLSKVRIDKWLGIPELERYEQFKARWHTLVRSLQTRLVQEPSAETVQQINMYFLQVFFMTPYKEADFFMQADRRLHLFGKKVL